VLAYLTAALFVCCGVLSLVLAIIGWDGTSDRAEAVAAIIGIVFAEDITGNIDFGIAATMTVACTVLALALAMLTRWDPIRWVLALVGGVVTAYYTYALIYLLSNDAGEVVALVVAALLLWLAATVVAFLPATGRAMRGSARRQFAPPPAGYRGGRR
jgi:hypothetical protein